MTEPKFSELLAGISGVMLAARARVPRMLQRGAMLREQGLDDLARDVEDDAAWLALAASRLVELVSSVEPGAVPEAAIEPDASTVRMEIATIFDVKVSKPKDEPE